MKQLTAQQFAKLCGVTPQTVTNWRAAGMPCVGGGRQGVRAKIDIAKALPWVIARRDVRPGSERERYLRAQSERVEMKNKQRRGELCEVIDVQQEMAGIIKLFVQAIELLPDRIELNCVATPAQLELIESELDGLRNELYHRMTGEKPPKADTDEETRGEKK